jgi:hypothetical protein
MNLTKKKDGNHRCSSSCNNILKLQKILKLNVHVDNTVEIFDWKYLNCAKMKNSDINISEHCQISKSQNLSDFVIFMQPRT